ncbi:ankyrin repeat domain-containing protein [bacterium CPR1]|nr:ankyrin repeat domain-containing protein [bacterium CPR1]
MQSCLKRGSSLEERDSKGMTPLFWAIQQNQPEAVRLLLAERRQRPERERLAAPRRAA